MWTYELNTDRYFNPTSKMDISLLCNMSETTIKDAYCTSDLKSAATSISFNIRYNNYTAFYDTVIQYLLDNVQNRTKMYVRVIDVPEDGSTSTIMFQGVLCDESLELSSSKIAQGLSLTGKDFTVELDRKIGHNEIFESTESNYILLTTLVRTLLKYAGQGFFHTQDILVAVGKTYYTLDSNGIYNVVANPVVEEIATYYEWANPISASALSNVDYRDYFVLDEKADSNTTYRDKIDRLLFEAPGFSLHYVHATGTYEIVKTVAEPTDITLNTEPRTIDYAIKPQLKTSCAVYTKDGVVVNWFTVMQKENQTVYSADLGAKFDEATSQITGTILSAKTENVTYYYPDTGALENVTQSFSMPDREYELGLSKMKNSDISLLYVKPNTATLYTQSFGGDLKHDPYIGTNVKLPQNPMFYPTYCQFLLWNNSTTEDCDVWRASIEGTVVFKSRKNKYTCPSTVKDPEEYTSEIYNSTQAEKFTSWYYNAKRVSQTSTTWVEYEDSRSRSHLGERVYIQHKGVGLKQEYVVIQIDNMPMIGKKRQYKITALAVDGWVSEPIVGKSGVLDNYIPTGKRILSTMYYYKVTTTQTQPLPEDITSTTVPTMSETDKFLWRKEVITYSDSTSKTSISLNAIYGDQGIQGIQGNKGDKGDTGEKGDKGDTGNAGQSTFKSIVFKRTNETPQTPTGGSYASPIPTDWSDGVPSGDAVLWMSTRIFTSDGELPQTSAWTTPSQATDTETLDFEYSAVATNPGNPTENPSNWHNSPTSADIWMAMRTKLNGVYGDWQITKVKGEQGIQGNPGRDGRDGTDGQDGDPADVWDFKIQYETYIRNLRNSGNNPAIALTVDKQGAFATTTAHWSTTNGNLSSTTGDNVTLTIPYVNSYNTVTITLSDGNTHDVSKTINVVDMTPSPMYLGLRKSSLPSSTPSGELLINGDYFVVGDTDFSQGGVTYKKGVAYEKNNNTWNELNDANKLLNCLDGLLSDSTINLEAISDSGTISWFNTIVAKKVIARSMFTEDLEMGGEGVIRSSNWVDGQSGFRLTSSSGKIESYSFKAYAGSEFRGDIVTDYFKTSSGGVGYSIADYNTSTASKIYLVNDLIGWNSIWNLDVPHNTTVSVTNSKIGNTSISYVNRSLTHSRGIGAFYGWAIRNNTLYMSDNETSCTPWTVDANVQSSITYEGRTITSDSLTRYPSHAALYNALTNNGTVTSCNNLPLSGSITIDGVLQNSVTLTINNGEATLSGDTKTYSLTATDYAYGRTIVVSGASIVTGQAGIEVANILRTTTTSDIGANGLPFRNLYAQTVNTTTVNATTVYGAVFN